MLTKTAKKNIFFFRHPWVSMIFPIRQKYYFFIFCLLFLRYSLSILVSFVHICLKMTEIQKVKKLQIYWIFKFLKFPLICITMLYTSYFRRKIVYPLLTNNWNSQTCFLLLIKKRQLLNLFYFCSCNKPSTYE